MKKFIFTATIFGVVVFLSNNPAIAQDNSEDAYDNAYYACSDKADANEETYDQVFVECMKSMGFSIEEDEHNHEMDEESYGE